MSNDVSGFGERHRESITDSLDDRGSALDVERESCSTTGFDFYVGKLATNL